MRKIIDLILLFLLVCLLIWQRERLIYSYGYFLSSPCDQPLTYRLGEVDSGYGLSKDQFLSKIESGNQIWSKVVSKNLFAYKTDGEIEFNLIYSDRQSMIDQLDTLESNLQTGKQSLNSLLAEYKGLQADFENKLQAFNAEVEKWNKQGGAPEEVFNRLKSQQAELQIEADRLNQMAGRLNLTAQKYNLEVSQYNQSAKKFEQALNETPEAGIYDSSIPKIDIYLTNSNEELVHTLTHEMGHALNLPHNDNSQSIMYPSSNEVLEPDSLESSQLQAYCNQKNINLLITNLRELVNSKTENFKTTN